MNTSRSDINLKDLLEYMGEDVIPHGRNSFKLRRHDSLIITENKFYWNSKQIGGNYFTLLKELYGLDNKEIYDKTQLFLEAIEYGEYIPNKTNYEREKRNNGNKILKKNCINEIKEYLRDKRGIEDRIIELLYKNELLYMDNKKNIIFEIRKENGVKCGEEIIGTGKVKYRANTSDSKGFTLTRRNVKDYPVIKNLYIFEGTIDMLSYIQMEMENINDKWKDENVRFLTLSGLREDILKNYLKDIENIYVCTDNDLAGENFYLNIKDKYKDINFYREKSIGKDWNEDLLNRIKDNYSWMKENDKDNVLER